MEYPCRVIWEIEKLSVAEQEAIASQPTYSPNNLPTETSKSLKAKGKTTP